MLKLERLAAFVLAALAVVGCTHPVGPQESGVAFAPRWQTLAPTQEHAELIVSNDETKTDQQWWTHFHDRALDALIGEALAGNKSLAIARARVEEPRAVRLQAPQVNAVASGERGNRGLLTNDRSVTVNQAALSAAWEVDLFGRNQARTAQAAAILQSTQASEQAVRVALLSEVARTYFELRNLDRQIALTTGNLDTQRKTLKLVEAQQRGALVSNFDVQRAAAQTSATEARVPSLRASRDAAANRLSTLLGRAPGTLPQAARARSAVEAIPTHRAVATAQDCCSPCLSWDRTAAARRERGAADTSPHRRHFPVVAKAHFGASRAADFLYLVPSTGEAFPAIGSWVRRDGDLKRFHR